MKEKHTYTCVQLVLLTNSTTEGYAQGPTSRSRTSAYPKGDACVVSKAAAVDGAQRNFKSTRYRGTPRGQQERPPT
jgi:hypothetical protein